MRWHESRAAVRFDEIDSFGVLWHGHYAKYFEVGRLDLSKQFNLSIEELGQLGYYAPVVNLGCRFREPARYGDEITVKTTVEPLESASLTFQYQLVRRSDGTILAEGFTSHVLLTTEGKMLYLVPPELEKPLHEMIAYYNG